MQTYTVRLNVEDSEDRADQTVEVEARSDSEALLRAGAEMHDRGWFEEDTHVHRISVSTLDHLTAEEALNGYHNR